MDRLLGNALETGIFGQIRNVAVHFPIYLYILDDLVLVRFQSAVHVVQLDACYPTGCGIVQFGRQILGQLVVLAVLLPS